MLATVAGASLLGVRHVGGREPHSAHRLHGADLYWSGVRGCVVNLAANWRLIRETGTSSSILAKAAHDLVAARSESRLARRIAADAGYVCFELAKEAPWYVPEHSAPPS